jgi:hypothetical protein
MVDLLTKSPKEKHDSAAMQANWERPSEGVLKINTDGAFVQETRVGAWGFTIRDHTGDTIVSGAGNAGHVHDVLTAKAWGCLKALACAEAQVCPESKSK